MLKAEDMIKLQINCRGCGTEFHFTLPRADIKAWKQGEMIQKALPYLHSSERELIKTRICSVCWDATFQGDTNEG